MRLDSARGLKQQLLQEVVTPFSARVDRLHRLGAGAVTSAPAAAGIADGRPIFGIGARPSATVPRLQRSIALGISRQRDAYRLAVRGREPSERVARLRFWITLRTAGANVVDAALAAIEPGVGTDASRLRELVDGADRTLAGSGPEFVDEGETVRKIGRTTGPTEGRVMAFDLDNLVVNYDMGNLRFDNQLEIEGAGNQAFSDGGDSGSLIVNAAEAVALLFAGSDVGGSNGLGLTYANPIQRVLQDLRSTLLS